MATICPKGWTLPTSSDYVNLITTVYGIANSSAGSTSVRSAPLSFVYTGLYDATGSFSLDSSYGLYWSRTAYSTSFAYLLYFNDRSVIPQNNNPRGAGYAVRCVAK